MKRVLLTGSTGFIGRHAIVTLKERGFEIHAIGRDDPGVSEVTFHHFDLLAHGAIDGVVRSARPSHLLHLAWYGGAAGLRSSSENLKWVGATLTLLRAFAEAGGRRAILAGTCAEYGPRASTCDEALTSCEPASLYGVAKDATRRVAERYASISGLSMAWARIFYLYGPGEAAGRLVSDAIEALTAGRPFPVTEGKQRRDFMHVRDAAGALAALIDCDVRGPVNIGSGSAIAVRSLLGILTAITGGAHLLEFGALPLPADEGPVVEAAVRRLSLEVGYRPVFGLTEGLADAVSRWLDGSGTRLHRQAGYPAVQSAGHD